MELRRIPLLMGKRCPYTSSGGVHLNNEREIRIWMDQGRGSAEGILKLLEGFNSCRVPE